ncbi:MAG TPA: 50S ribosomal protein L18 [Gemmatimonadota bacterium]|nr:50S ribosomal protein L18 [Gemmatimonadota bacterium]
MSGHDHRRRETTRRRRHQRIRRRVSGTAERPRLVVHRSLKNITAQIVDDSTGRTLLGITSESADGEGSKVDRARETGRRLGERAREAGVTRVVFDRGGYLYHGRVRALAEGAREGGLEF